MSKKKTANTGGTVRGGGNGNGHSKDTTTKAASQPVYSADGKHIIGHVNGDTFHKSVKGSKHMLRKPRGWAVDTSALDDARALGAVNVAVTDTETETAYITPIDTFFRYGVPLNRGFGPQLVLPLGYWSVDGKPPRMGEPPQPNQPAPDTPRQLPLFAEV